MALTVRRLGPGDEALLARLAHEAADFDVAGRGVPLQPLTSEAARRYLTNPAVLHWVAFADSTPIGSLYCILLPLDTEDGGELLLYDIGVHYAWRRQGVGRLLVAEMEDWMDTNGVAVVWVLADNQVAVDFYQTCGFAIEDEQPVYMTRLLNTRDS